MRLLQADKVCTKSLKPSQKSLAAFLASAAKKCDAESMWQKFSALRSWTFCGIPGQYAKSTFRDNQRNLPLKATFRCRCSIRSKREHPPLKVPFRGALCAASRFSLKYFGCLFMVSLFMKQLTDTQNRIHIQNKPYT